MNDEELIDEMVRRLGTEVKGLLSQVRRGQIPAAPVEGLLQEQLWHVGAQAIGVIPEALDQELVSARAVHDHREHKGFGDYPAFKWGQSDSQWSLTRINFSANTLFRPSRDQRLPGSLKRDCTRNLHEPSTAPVPIGKCICRKRPYRIRNRFRRKYSRCSPADLACWADRFP